jgi:hypothetical protein
MKRILLAGVLGGVVAFMWGALSWSVLPFQTGKFRNIPDEARVAEVLRGALPAAGVYHYPGYPAPGASAAEEAEWVRRYERGPVVPLLVYLPRGAGGAGASYVRALLLDVAGATLLAALLALAADRLPSFGRRLAFVVGVAGFAALVSHVADWSWGVLPASYSVVMAADILAAWALGGAVLAWRIGPPGPSVSRAAGGRRAA